MPDLLEQPPTPTAEPRSPSPAMEDFDKTFADLDTPTPEPAPAPTPTPPEPTPNEPQKTTETAPRPTPPKDPATGKFTKAEPGVPQTGTTGKPALPVEPARTGQTEFTPPQVAKPSELRNWAQRMGGRAEQAERQLSQLNAKVRELESRQPQQADTKALMDELAQTKQRLQEYEGELKVTRYERSAEYKENYERPYQNAVKNAYSEVKELLVSVPNPNDPDNPQERQATPADFDEVYNLPLGPATKLAKAKFGDAASIVIQHVKAIKDAARAAVGAVEQHKGKAEEFEKQQTAQQRMIEEGRSRMFGEAIQSIHGKYPNIFGPRQDDTAWNENWNKGTRIADMAFSDRQGMTPAQSAILDAQVHARVSAFPGLMAENARLKADLASRDKEIADLRGSSPGKPGAAPVDTKPNESALTMEQAFDRAMPG